MRMINDNDSADKLVVQRGILFRRTIRASYATLDIVVDTSQSPSSTSLSSTASTNSNSCSDDDASNHHQEEEEEGQGENTSDLVGIVRNQEKTPSHDTQQDTQQHVTILLQFHRNDKAETTTPSSSLSSTSSTSSITARRSHIRRISKLGTLIEVRGGKWLLPQPSCMSLSKARRLEVRYSVDTSTTDSDTNTSTPSILKILQIQKWDMVQCQKALAKYYPLRHAYTKSSQPNTNTTTKNAQPPRRQQQQQQQQQQSN